MVEKFISILREREHDCDQERWAMTDCGVCAEIGQLLG